MECCFSTCFYPIVLFSLLVVARGQLIDDEMSQHNLPKPRFVGSVENKTAPLGREAILECSVDNLGNYKVTWIKMDTETLLTFHTTIIAGENRLRVSHNNEKQWFLHIRDVQVSDKGAYMCQINSQPMINQVGYLDVLIPPSILSDEILSEVRVNEGQNATLRCKATGYPTPSISWKREDGKEISVARHHFNSNELAQGHRSTKKHSAHQVTGEELELVGVKREDSGAYLCIAKNNVTPTVSHRVMLIANFAPRISINRTDFGVVRGDPAQLECVVEASPRPEIDWFGTSGSKLNITHNHEKHVSSSTSNQWYMHRYELLIHNTTHQDYGEYRCRVENEFGSREATIRIYEKPRPTVRPRPTRPLTTTASKPTAPTRRTTRRWFTTVETFAVPEGIETANRVPSEKETGRRKGTRTPPFYERSSIAPQRVSSRSLLIVLPLYIILSVI